MRTRITWIALTMATVAGTSLAAVSCSPDATAPVVTAANPALPAPQAQALHDQYAWMGKYHNDALTYALDRIKASRKTGKYDRCKAGLAALKDFQKSFRKSGGPAIFDDLTITDGMCEAQVAGKTGTSQSRDIPVDRAGRRADISTAANDYMNQIANQVDYAASVPALAFSVAQIENQAAWALDFLEAGAVFGTGSITVSSADYWTVNESSWAGDQQLQYTRAGDGFSPPSSPVNVSNRTRRIIKADVMAAIGVLVYDWWMGEAAIGKAAIKAAAASLVAGIFMT